VCIEIELSSYTIAAAFSRSVNSLSSMVIRAKLAVIRLELFMLVSNYSEEKASLFLVFFSINLSAPIDWNSKSDAVPPKWLTEGALDGP
jgi:hypothetical protein